MKNHLNRLIILGLLSCPVFADQRVVVLGDVHGDIHGLTRLLRHAEIIDRSDNWIGRDTVFVQVGDFLDRGAEVRQVMDLFQKMQKQAQEDGGIVEVLLGNHEAMNMIGLMQDVSPDVYKTFIDPDSRKRQKSGYKAYLQMLKKLTKDTGQKLEPITKRTFFDTYPLGLMEYFEALGPEGHYGRWLRKRPAYFQVGEVGFVHGGFDPTDARNDIKTVNQRMHDHIRHIDASRMFLVEQEWGLPFMKIEDLFAIARVLLKSLMDKGEAISSTQSKQLEELKSMVALGGGDLMRQNSALWFRGYMEWTEEEGNKILDPFFEKMPFSTLVCGHNPVGAGISVRFNSRIFQIDTGLALGRGKKPSLLEYKSGVFSALYNGKRQVLVPKFDESQITGKVINKWKTKEGELLPFKNEAEIREFLQKATVVSQMELDSGTTKPLRLDLEMDGVRLRGIFHTRDEEIRELIMPKGRNLKHVKDRYVFECPAYLISVLLGLDRIPPVVLRKYDGKEGSLQLWVENAFSEKERLSQNLNPPDLLSWSRDQAEMDIFDYLIHNIDRNQGNILYTQDWQQWFIDHTRAFRVVGEPTKLDELKTIYKTFWEKLQSTPDELLQAALAPYLTKTEIRLTLKRRNQLVTHFKEQIKSRGVEQVVFPDREN